LIGKIASIDHLVKETLILRMTTLAGSNWYWSKWVRYFMDSSGLSMSSKDKVNFQVSNEYYFTQSQTWLKISLYS
jgi:uncharacterized membrane protein